MGMEKPSRKIKLRSNAIMVDMLFAIGAVIAIDLILSGDNAVVIALACRNLPPKQRKKGIIFGTSLAVVLRVALVIIVTLLMRIPYLQFVGGLALVYIGYSLLVSGSDDDVNVESNDSLIKAIKTIVVADLIMSIDNVMAIAGVAKGRWGVLIFGLALSIPLMVFCATILSKLMSRFPIIVYLGAGLIAFVAAEMMVLDPKLQYLLEPFALAIEIVIPVGVLALGFLIKRRARIVKEKE